jgi:hypothetical protein
VSAVACPIDHDHRPATAPTLRLVSDSRRTRRTVSPGTFARRRAIAVLAVVGFVVATYYGLVVLGSLGGGPASAPEPSPVPAVATRAAGAAYVVQPGDTFWAIARAMHPRGDVRAVVDRLIAIHGPGELRAGETIVLPGAA